MACGEFDLIARYFDRFRSNRRDVELGIGDDCALLTVAEKQLLAISTDTLVSGVHFLADIDPADLGYKSLAVNLSDLAAMGADPAYGYLLLLPYPMSMKTGCNPSVTVYLISLIITVCS